jgi:hypothetical protein
VPGQNKENLGKGWQMPFPPFSTTYAKFAAALMRLHGIPAEQASAFHSRLGALQKAGLLGDQPGRGNRIEYGPEHFHRALLAFELVQAGIPPGVILRLIKDCWPRLNAIVMKAEKAIVRPAEDNANDVILVLSLGLFDDTIKAINSVTKDNVGEVIRLALDPRVLLVNLSMQLRKFHDNLAVLHLKPDELFEMAERGAQAMPKKKMSVKPKGKVT